MPLPQPALRPQQPHIHIAGDRCPYCDQPVPNEKAAAIKARIEADDRKRTEAITERLRAQHAQDTAKALAAGREEGKKLAEDAAQQKIDALTKQNAANQQKVAQAEQQKNQALAQFASLKANHDEEVTKRVAEAREALEKANVTALHAQAAKHFDEKQKLTAMVEDLKRKLDKQTAGEIGEGAEIELLDALKEEFPQDRIDHIGNNPPGADIRHVVMHNGKEAGIIIYDSKNRKAWRDEYAEKLARDQKAAKADHAILAALKFPRDTAQLHIQDGVIIANPARIVALVQMLRKQLIHVHTLRLSGTDRARKTAKLYEFITSKRCTQLLDSIDTNAEELLELQEKEQRAHQATWKRQGTLVRSIQKTRGDLIAEIDQIIESD